MRLPVHTVILPPMLDSPVLTESQVIAHAFAMGKVGLLPTDTLWGLSGLAVAEVAQRIQSLKHRDEPKPLILLVDDLTCMSAWLQPLTESQQRFCARHWPGPVTVLLPVTEQAPVHITAGKPTVGVRIPAVPRLRALLALLGQPLISTSANLTGEPPANDPLVLAHQWGAAVDFCVDWDNPRGQASAIWDLSQEPPKQLR